MGVVAAGREGRDGRAVLSALFGGIVAVGALMFLVGRDDHGHDLERHPLDVTGGWYTRPAPPRVMGPHRLEA